MKQVIDGCTAAAHVAYALSDIATIYPITPIASMGNTADSWAHQGRLNVFGAPMQVKELESELGAAGATHGALVGGALATTFTSSQGLLLMIPNMFKISGELLPAVFHVGTRSIATHALSIFGDHQDVMACRSTGFAMLASADVQETMDLGVVAHLAAIEGRVPVLHFFDGWRTSNELNTIDVIPYDTISTLVDRDAVSAFRARAMNPLHPDLRGSAQNPDVYFQNREAANKYYNAFPAIVQRAMDRLAAATGRKYSLFDYYGDPEAEYVAVSMGSSVHVLRDAVNHLNASGMKTGVLAVRLYRPFDASAFISAIPESAKVIIALDRTKEPGAQAEPLLLDVMSAVHDAGRDTLVIGGRYGLSSKEFDPSMAKQIFINAAAESPKRRFSVGIVDDVTHLSLPIVPEILCDDPSVKQALFYGIGADGSVGATRQAANIIAATDGLYAQAYFHYSAKKSGGYTLSELRYADKPITAEYSIELADYVGCHKDTYVNRFRLTEKMRPGGTFVLNSKWSVDEMSAIFPASLKRDIARKGLKFYNIDASGLAAEVGLGVRINVIMESVFFYLTAAVPFDSAIATMKQLVSKAYMHEGGDIVARNLKAIDGTVQRLQQIEVPTDWANAVDAPKPAPQVVTPTQKFVETIAKPCMAREGDKLPVSAFTPDGTMPMGTTVWEKRRIARMVPEWDPAKCIQCTECSLVCPHAAIRPFLLDADEQAKAPAQFATVPCKYKGFQDYTYRIQVYPEDCTGCGSCANICPGHALSMQPIDTQLPLQVKMLDFAQTLTPKDDLFTPNWIPGTQFQTPMLEFSGACAGCGETPYVKLLTQLFGRHMVIANATGCSSIWGANYPSNAYCTDAKGHGPAWGNSLFEDNAEYGFGIASAFAHRRNALLSAANAAVTDPSVAAEVQSALRKWIDAFSDSALSESAGQELIQAIKAQPANKLTDVFVANADMLGKKSVWIVGGDGWAYDIGFAGLDHVLAQNIDINMLVLDTECYSNTGGQMSKATPVGAVVKYATQGKRTAKKDLGRMMMTYGNIYVAQVALGANYLQTINALREAESYPGPSIVIAYCPCIEHGIRTGMGTTIIEEKRAVQAGYWQIYRYNPTLEAQGKDPLSLDMAKPDPTLDAFLMNEDRYADLKVVDPKDAPVLENRLLRRTTRIYNILADDAAKEPGMKSQPSQQQPTQQQ